MRSSFSILFVLLAFSFFGQDKIYLISKQVVKAKVVSVDDNEVKYYDLEVSPQVLRRINRTSVKKIIREHKDKDTSNYFRIGVIPYQLLSRSSGAYISYKFKKPLTLEYRYTYTFATELLNNNFPYSKFFFMGDNHTLVLSRNFKRTRNSIGFILGYKHWWFSQKPIPPEGFSLVSSFSAYTTITSTNIRGVNFGVEYCQDFSFKKFHGVLFTDLSATLFSGTRSQHKRGQPYYYVEDNSYAISFVHLAIGFKLGGRIKANKSKKDPV